MKETFVQRRVIEAVQSQGGAAHKLSNRFMAGVPDLLVKLPRYPAALLEVKIDKHPVKSTTVTLGVTKLQETFLEKYEKAGMATGVMAFLQHRRDLYVSLWSVAELVKRKYVVPVHAYNRLRPHVELQHEDICTDIGHYIGSYK